MHLVDVEYNDGQAPYEESLLWELEPQRRLIPATNLPPVGNQQPMSPQELTALIRACRWTAQSPFIDPDGSGPLDRLPIASPFHGAVQVEDFQLVPLLKALRMPRVSLLIADDVGIGKTIEAGYILTELLLRRRIRRVLILTPASLRVQWRDELDEKFALPFEIVDRSTTQQLRRQLGMDANPWRTHSRIITSYHYLKQHDILEEFRAASRSERQTAHLPWDLLIVDEVHNLAPAPIGQESDLCEMLRQVSPLFEHRLFLTATPHNGHTRSFTGLLEMLDPVRFSQSHELRGRERERVPDVLVRRLKREINERTDPPLFCERKDPIALALNLSPAEHSLSEAFDALRSSTHKLLAEDGRRRRLAGAFAIEILGKRLLSCPTAFADSWWRCRQGIEEDDSVSDQEVLAAKRSVAEETVDDREAESRRRAASTAVGAWLRPMADALAAEFGQIDASLADLALDKPGTDLTTHDPKFDARYAALRALIESHLRSDNSWRDDERLIIFTEYKTTLDYLLRRLRKDYEDERILFLYGGMDDNERDPVKDAFNDPLNKVRILVATDAASEGLNLQSTARYLLHYDVPWNPARLEQRNGRLDRHGQARDVQTWHFVSAGDHDLRFLSYVVGKVDTIREDLGATGEVFDEITHRRLVDGESADDLQRELDAKVETVREATSAIPRDDQVSTSDDGDEAKKAAVHLEALASELDLSPDTVRDTLDTAMGLHLGRPRLEPIGEELRYRLCDPYPQLWTQLIDDTLRRAGTGTRGPVKALAFDPRTFIHMISGRPIFKPRRDTALLHLAHPMIRRAIQALARRRFPGQDEVSRWSIRRAPIPEDCDALVLLTLEELAVNELRETFHHWVRTLRLPLRGGRLTEPLNHLPARELVSRNGIEVPDPALVEEAFDLWETAEDDLKAVLELHAEQLSADLVTQLKSDRERALAQETERYQSRQGEISALIESSTLARLEREIKDLHQERKQGRLGYAAYEIDKLDRDIEVRKEEIRRRKQHYEEVREELKRERERIVEELIPKRYALRGYAQALPVAVEILLPEAGA